MRDSGRPVAWERLSLRLIPGYGSVSKVVRRSSTCSLEKLVLFLREEPPLEAAGLASSEGRGESRFSQDPGPSPVLNGLVFVWTRSCVITPKASFYVSRSAVYIHTYTQVEYGR